MEMPHGPFSGTLSFKVLAVDGKTLLGSNHWWVGFPCSDHGASLQENQRAWRSTSIYANFYWRVIVCSWKFSIS